MSEPNPETTPIEVGGTYPFYCEMQQEYEPPENRLRRFTGTLVKVLRHLSREEYDGPGPDDPDEWFEVSRAFEVEAWDGTTFVVHTEEIDGWDYALDQFFWNDATSGKSHDTSFLGNERRDLSTALSDWCVARLKDSREADEIDRDTPDDVIDREAQRLEIEIHKFVSSFVDNDFDERPDRPTNELESA